MLPFFFIEMDILFHCWVLFVFTGRGKELERTKWMLYGRPGSERQYPAKYDQFNRVHDLCIESSRTEKSIWCSFREVWTSCTTASGTLTPMLPGFISRWKRETLCSFIPCLSMDPEWTRPKGSERYGECPSNLAISCMYTPSGYIVIFRFYLYVWWLSVCLLFHVPIENIWIPSYEDVTIVVKGCKM